MHSHSSPLRVCACPSQCSTLEAYTFLRPEACFVYDDNISGTAGGAGSGVGKQQGQQKAAAGGGRRLEGAEAEGAEALSGSVNSRRLAAGKQGAAADGAKAQAKQTKQQQKGKKAGGAAPRQQAPKQQAPKQAVPGKGGPASPPADPQDSSYSAAILAALRSESSIAAHQAVRALKAEVMNHNVAVAAAFMAETEGQYSADERDADRRSWALRRQQRLQPSQSIR